MSESSLYNDIAAGLREAIAYEHGELEAQTTRLVKSFPAPPEWTPDKVKELRLQIPLTQSAFASLMGVSVKTVEAWENGRNRPNGSASRLMQLLAKEDDSKDASRSSKSLVNFLSHESL